MSFDKMCFYETSFNKMLFVEMSFYEMCFDKMSSGEKSALPKRLERNLSYIDFHFETKTLFFIFRFNGFQNTRADPSTDQSDNGGRI